MFLSYCSGTTLHEEKLELLLPAGAWCCTLSRVQGFRDPLQTHQQHIPAVTVPKHLFRVLQATQLDNRYCGAGRCMLCWRCANFSDDLFTRANFALRSKNRCWGKFPSHYTLANLPPLCSLWVFSVLITLASSKALRTPSSQCCSVTTFNLSHSWEHWINSFPLPFQLDVWLGFLSEHLETIVLEVLALQCLYHTAGSCHTEIKLWRISQSKSASLLSDTFCGSSAHTQLPVK